jgi:4-hydroxy-3-methylbut-2-enyl diphosphate reductase
MVTFMNGSGFCAGVRFAVEKAEKLHEMILAGKQVYLYGDLVNNTHVMRSFSDKGFRLIDPDKPEQISMIPDGAIVVIRAHGIPRAVEDILRASNAVVKDYTCGRVKKIHKIVDAKSSGGYKIVVVGNKKHPEVIGITGWCCTPSIVVESASDLEGVDLSGKTCVVAQTTCDHELWRDISSLILSRNPTADIHDTLCGVISNREEMAKKIAASADIMFVIGDSESSNSKRLYNQCCSVNRETYPITSLFRLYPPPVKPPFIYSLFELERKPEIAGIFQKNSSIGLTASASTPDEIIYTVRDYLLFIEFINTARTEIEDVSRDFFSDHCSQAPDNSFVQSSLADLRERNEGGKRIRGAMIKLGEKIVSHGTNKNYLPIAAGYELFQTAVLIHDDIIDKGDIRRNKATIHVESAKRIKDRIKDRINMPAISDVIAGHFGMSRALCIGDYGFFMSYQFLSMCKVDSSVLTKIYSLYSKILATTCEGEIMDTILPFEKPSILDNYDEYIKIVSQIYEYKTSWYTLAGPIMLGAVCGGAGDELIELLKNITIPLGIAYQIKDDLLGIYSSKDVIGKSVLSDIMENKQTLMYGFAYKSANEQQRVLLDKHYGKESADEDDLEIIRELFEETGAKQYAENEIQSLSEHSRALIANNMIDEEYRSILYGLINYLVGRSY